MVSKPSLSCAPTTRQSRLMSATVGARCATYADLGSVSLPLVALLGLTIWRADRARRSGATRRTMAQRAAVGLRARYCVENHRQLLFRAPLRSPLSALMCSSSFALAVWRSLAADALFARSGYASCALWRRASRAVCRCCRCCCCLCRARSARSPPRPEVRGSRALKVLNSPGWHLNARGVMTNWQIGHFVRSRRNLATLQPLLLLSVVAVGGVGNIAEQTNGRFSGWQLCETVRRV